ncbi:MAG TPA: hypothetical protein VLE02_06650 [Nitrosarchaeum sp.]|nr:hypothetical protein [Nitrosarchaeum sp.]
MTIIIFSNGVITQRKSRQSIKSHIKDHEKNWWISEFMRLSECDYETALIKYNEVFSK